MSELEQKEVHLNVLRGKADVQLKNKHPASDKIQVNICLSLSVCWFCVMFYCCVTHSENWCVCLKAYMETLQTQWSWLLQITRCIQVHLKENTQYSQVTVIHIILQKLVMNQLSESPKWFILKRGTHTHFNGSEMCFHVMYVHRSSDHVLMHTETRNTNQ